MPVIPWSELLELDFGGELNFLRGSFRFGLDLPPSQDASGK